VQHVFLIFVSAFQADEGCGGWFYRKGVALSWDVKAFQAYYLYANRLFFTQWTLIIGHSTLDIFEFF